MKKKVLLVDVDEVICFEGFLEAINEFLGTSYEIDDFTNFYIDEEAIPKEKFAEFTEFVSKRNLYENPYILPGAVETIKKLNEHYELYLCSACLQFFDKKNSGRVFKEKFDFLYRLLPFIPPEKYIFTSAKHIFKADIRIDDLIGNFDSNVETNILFPSYHNKDITDEELKEKGVIRVGYDWRTGWEQVGKILLETKEK